jgi:hypothetical protein
MDENLLKGLEKMKIEIEIHIEKRKAVSKAIRRN